MARIIHVSDLLRFRSDGWGCEKSKNKTIFGNIDLNPWESELDTYERLAK